MAAGFVLGDSPIADRFEKQGKPLARDPTACCTKVQLDGRGAATYSCAPSGTSVSARHTYQEPNVNRRIINLLLMMMVASSAACLSPGGDTVDEQRANGIAERDRALNEYFIREPLAKAELERSPGYLFFKGGSLHLGLISLALGYVLVTDNKTNEVAYRKIFRFGLGPGLAIKSFYNVSWPGLAIKSFYNVSLIRDEALVKKLQSDSSKFFMGAGAEVSFRIGDFGGTLDAASSFNHDIDTSIWTKNGASIELLIAGLYSWSNDKLNDKSSTAPKP
jgi:hypothetical protein